MDINEIRISASGCVNCVSRAYTVCDFLDEQKFLFNKGANILYGDIDSGIFGISYLISMYEKIDKRNLMSFQLPLEATVNGEKMPISELAKYSCYIDSSYNLYSTKRTVREQVTKGLKHSKLSYNADEICEIFRMEKFRFDSPLKATGNERYQAMAAIGFSYGKQVFCFPWLSKTRYENFKVRIPFLLDVLASYGKISILPLGM